MSLPPPGKGSHLLDILDRCRKGEIKALYLIGENPLETLPASLDVKGALANLEVLICQDPFLTEIGELAHVVFPASTFAEKDGTVTNQEGKVQFLRPALDSLGESVLDWHVIAGIANGLGSPLGYETTQDIQQEIRKVLPGYYNLGRPSKVSPKVTHYFGEEFGQQVGERYRLPAKDHNQRQFGLRMIQLLYHSGKLSTQASGLLEISPNTKSLGMGPEDMKHLGLTSGDRIRVTSDEGSLEMLVKEDTTLLPGSCSVPEHFNDPPVKDLMSLQADPVTGVPYFKLAYVSIEKA